MTEDSGEVSGRFSVGRVLPTGFDRRVVMILPGDVKAYVEKEWSDAIVLLEHGDLELECSLGRRRKFGAGDILWFTGMSLRAMHNVGLEPVVLVAVSRRHRARRQHPLIPV